ncbi:MAG: aminotransferase class V-fold PLP-dependent enzyme [Clostridia bacterium]|nr:aminotransferase class V-fold PLP-dependent enzyme [Deltaproteobacteria bacterium]
MSIIQDFTRPGPATLERTRLFQRIATDFMGLDRRDPVVALDGTMTSRRRVYLDTTATALMPKLIAESLNDYYAHACANSHTEAHRAGRDTTAAIEHSRDAIGRLVGYDPRKDVVLFTANGATGATNFLARALFPPELRPLIKRFPNGAPATFRETFRAALGTDLRGVLDELEARPLIVTSVMEHHSNLLPWIEAVGHQNIRAIGVNGADGTLDMAELARVLETEGHRVRLVAITGVSNVTGIVNPVHQIARLAHKAGAQILVDGAQWVPHAQINLHPGDGVSDIDFLTLSGHKLYAPGSRGALIGNTATFECRRCVSDVGGGMVEYVAIDDYDVKKQVAAREEAGTPNIPGTIAMGMIADMLMKVGMDVIADAEHDLTAMLLERMTRIDGLRIYGSADPTKRAGVVSFNIKGFEHGLLAAYLNDFHNIAVRDGCFCAHPYVKQLMRFGVEEEKCFRTQMVQGDRRNIPGMVRASLGIYSTPDDVEALGQALEAFVKDASTIAGRYSVHMDGTYRLKNAPPHPSTFDIENIVDAWASGEDWLFQH